MIAILTLEEPIGPLHEFAEQVQRLLGPSMEVVLDRAVHGLQVLVEGETLHLLPRPSPLPWKLFAGPVADAWYWPEAEQVLRAHQAHLLIVLRPSKMRPLVRSLLVTRIAALLGTSVGYSAVYWDSAAMVHSRAAFSTSAAEMNLSQIPLRLWVSFRVAQEPDGSNSLATTGLGIFGKKEIEIWGSRVDPQLLIQWAYNAAYHLVSQDAEYQEGETVATSQQDWVRVFLRPSMLDPNREVYCLKVDGEGRQTPEEIS